MMLAFIFVMTTMAAESAHRIAEVLKHKPTLTSPKALGLRKLLTVASALNTSPFPLQRRRRS